MTGEPSDRGATLSLSLALPPKRVTRQCSTWPLRRRAPFSDGHPNTMFFNRFSLDEIHTRGLLATGRVRNSSLGETTATALRSHG